MMKKNTITLLTAAIVLSGLSSCSWLMQPEEPVRIPEPPPGPQKSIKSHNQYQKFEADHALGPLSTPRR